MSVYFSSLDKMETRSSRLDPTRNALWRRNIENEVWPLLDLLVSMEGWHMSVSDRNHCLRIASRVEEVYEPLQRLDREWALSPCEIQRYREWAMRKLMDLSVSETMHGVEEVFQRNRLFNS